MSALSQINLGFTGAFLPKFGGKAQPNEELDSAYTCKIGGVPTDWSGQELQAVSALKCRVCAQSTILLCQIFCPVPDEDDEECQFHRCLYVVGCITSSCKDFRIFRLQKPLSQLIDGPPQPSAPPPHAPEPSSASAGFDFFGGNSDPFDFGAPMQAEEVAPVDLSSLDALLTAHESRQPGSSNSESPDSGYQAEAQRQVGAGKSHKGRAFIRARYVEWDAEPADLSAAQLAEHSYAEAKLKEYYESEEQRKLKNEPEEVWGGPETLDGDGPDEDEDDDPEMLGIRPAFASADFGSEEEKRLVIRFQERVQRAPQQILRYHLGGAPLYIGATATYTRTSEDGLQSSDPRDSEEKAEESSDTENSLRKCTTCAAALQFEAQLMPYFHSVAEMSSVSGKKRHGEDDGQTVDMDWTTLDIYTCPNFCVPDSPASDSTDVFLEERIEIQAPML